jgi:hypothetical protein
MRLRGNAKSNAATGTADAGWEVASEVTLARYPVAGRLRACHEAGRRALPDVWLNSERVNTRDRL